MPQTILFADNDLDFLETRQTFLKNAGYHVIPATSPDEAKAILKKQKIDIAIIDVRLFNDEDEGDLSGLDLARTVAPSVPKIILTGLHPNLIQKTLMLQPEGSRVVVKCIDKKHGLQAMLTSIRGVLDNQLPLKKTNVKVNKHCNVIDLIFYLLYNKILKNPLFIFIINYTIYYIYIMIFF